MTSLTTTTRTAFTSPASQSIMRRLQDEATRKQASQNFDAWYAGEEAKAAIARKTGGFSLLR